MRKYGRKSFVSMRADTSHRTFSFNASKNFDVDLDRTFVDVALARFKLSSSSTSLPVLLDVAGMASGAESGLLFAIIGRALFFVFGRVFDFGANSAFTPRFIGFVWNPRISAASVIFVGGKDVPCAPALLSCA